jgi:hypothetical protein
LLSRIVKITSSAVISKPLPKAQHLILACRSKKVYGGEGFRKAQIISQSLLYTSLLKDNLGEPYFIGILRCTPRKVSPIFLIPRKEGGEHYKYRVKKKKDKRVKIKDAMRKIPPVVIFTLLSLLFTLSF